MPIYQPKYRGKCLHCQTIVRFESTPNNRGDWHTNVIGGNEQLVIAYTHCPNCQKLIVTIEKINLDHENGNYITGEEHIVWPISGGRAPAPQEVPNHISSDYNEASAVLQISAKASAALSRRCLQTILREAGKTKAKDLSAQIDEVIKNLPTNIATNLDAIRNIGNFAAHIQKSQQTGMILDVEPGEAEWNLDVLDSLFDFYYVRPAIEKQKRDELNKKLVEAGKPPMKEPPTN
ncbi:MAG: DUF4145 domain-containing protein [Anaerolineales bacterium]